MIIGPLMVTFVYCRHVIVPQNLKRDCCCFAVSVNVQKPTPSLKCLSSVRQYQRTVRRGMKLQSYLAIHVKVVLQVINNPCVGQLISRLMAIVQHVRCFDHPGHKQRPEVSGSSFISLLPVEIIIHIWARVQGFRGRPYR